MKTVMLSEARESILSAVLKVVLYSLGSAQSALFLQHGLATQRALVSKVSTPKLQPCFTEMTLAHLLSTYYVLDRLLTQEHHNCSYELRREHGMMAHTCHPRLGKWRQESGHPWLYSKSKASPDFLRYCCKITTTKNKTKKERKEKKENSSKNINSDPGFGR